MNGILPKVRKCPFFENMPLALLKLCPELTSTSYTQRGFSSCPMHSSYCSKEL